MVPYSADQDVPVQNASGARPDLQHRTARPTRRRPPVYAAVALAGVTLGALSVGVAVAGPTWLPAERLTAVGEDAYAPEIAVDAFGAVTMTWWRSDTPNYMVQATHRSPGGGWSTPQAISPADVDGFNARLSVDPQGTAVVAWEAFDGNGTAVQASVRPPGGGWGSPQTLSSPTGTSRDVTVAVAAGGAAVVAWERWDGSNWVIQAVARPAGGEWGAAVTLSVPGRTASDPEVALDPSGAATIVWRRSDGQSYIAQAASRPAGGAWGAPVNLSAAGHSASEPWVAADAAGNVIAVWRRFTGSDDIVQASSRPAVGTWSSPVNLSQPGGDGRSPMVAVGPAGQAAVVWRRSGGPDWIVQAATRTGAGAAWSAPASLSAPGEDATFPRVAVSGTGGAVAAWQRTSSGGRVIQTSRGDTATGAWGAPVDLTLTANDAVTPALAADAAGNAVVGWQRLDLAYFPIEASGFDGQGPAVAAIEVPASGVVGQPFTVTLSSADIWSGAGSVPVWDFGDGTAAVTGTTATHVFTAPGTYTVTVRTSDDLGNVTSVVRTIVIAGPATGTLPGGATGPAGGTPGPAAGGTRRLLRLDRVRLVYSKGKTTSGTRRPLGLRVRLSLAARVRVEIRRPGSRRPVSTLTRSLRAGTGTIRLRLRLPAGRYRILVSARRGFERSVTRVVRLTLRPGPTR